MKFHQVSALSTALNINSYFTDPNKPITTTSYLGKRNSMRVGIVGAGAIARFHADRWQKLPVTIAGAYDRHPDRAEAFCAHYGGQVFVTLEELLANVDLVTICTHTDAHKEGVIAAAKARVPVVCEKPFARHLQDAEEMAAACEATNT